jgi:hypothetical protein
MNDIPNWASSIIAVAVGLTPVLAILSARPIARLLYRALLPRPEVALQPGRDELVEVRRSSRSPTVAIKAR